jgi:hypothetical protein
MSLLILQNAQDADADAEEAVKTMLRRRDALKRKASSTVLNLIRVSPVTELRAGGNV